MKQALHSASGIRFLITEVRTNIQRAFNAINWRDVLGPFLIVVLMLPLAAVTPCAGADGERVVQPRPVADGGYAARSGGGCHHPRDRPGHRRRKICGTHRCYLAISRRKASYLPVGSRCMQQIRNAYCNVARILLDPGSFSHGQRCIWGIHTFITEAHMITKRAFNSASWHKAMCQCSSRRWRCRSRR